MSEMLSLTGPWFTKEMASITSAWPDRSDGLLMACPVWGAKYINRFRGYCLPTIMGAKNLAVLRGRCRLVLYTDRASFTRLWRALRGIEAEGIDYQIRLIPQEIMDHVPNASVNKFWILSIVHNVGMQMAGRAGTAFAMLMPDHLYAENYFPRLLELGKDHDGIAQTGISADIGNAASDIETFRQEDGTLAFPDRDLGDLGFRHLHPQTRASMMETASIPNSLPDMFSLTWQGKDSLHRYCCHMNAAYLSADLCASTEPVIPATMDAELPSFMPKDFYVPKVDDGLTFIEISDSTKDSRPVRIDFKTFAMRCWSTVLFRDSYIPYFQRVCEVPIHPREKFTSAEEIKRQHADIVALLMEAKPTAAIEWARTIVAQGLAERVHGKIA